MTLSNTRKLKAEFSFSANIFKPVRNDDSGNLNILKKCLTLPNDFEQVNDG